MTLSVRVMFNEPRRELASELEQSYAGCKSALLVAGFMTVEGIDALLRPMRREPRKLATLVVGAATWRALEAFDQLLGHGVPSERLLVHLGHSRRQSSMARHPFSRYHPMLHSKAYLFDMPGDQSVAYVGSHNLTGFALNGLNGEASVRLEGPSDDPAIVDIRAHIGSAASEAVQYDPTQKEAYAWWALQFTEGWRDKFNDTPRDAELKRTIVILAEGDQGPAKNDTIYLELPEGLGRIESLRAEFHLFIFETLPTSPAVALTMLDSAKYSAWCRTVGIEDDRGGRELRADWYLDGDPPRLRSAPRPFRPRPSSDMQQVRIQSYGEVRGKFDYLFDDGKATFEPVYDETSEVIAPESQLAALRALDLIPPEDRPWYRVKALRRSDGTEEDARSAALRSLTPEAGSYVLMSLRRRERRQASGSQLP